MVVSKLTSKRVRRYPAMALADNDQPAWTWMTAEGFASTDTVERRNEIR